MRRASAVGGKQRVRVLVNGIIFRLDLIRSASKELHTVVALGRQADTCAAKTSSGDCAGVSGCSWNSGTSLCDVADATVKSIVGVETLAGVFSTWNTCQIKEPVACTADANCKWVQRQLRNYEQKSRRDVCRRHGRQCVQDVHLRWYLLHELPRIGRDCIGLELVRLLFQREN